MTPLFAFTGDLFLGRGDTPTDCTTLARQFSPELRLVVNFEGTLFRDAAQLEPTRRKILLTSPLHALQDIAPLRPVLFSLANNHIADYGNEVAQLTHDVLGAVAPTFGAGYAGTQFHLTSVADGGVRVGLAAYCTHETSPLFATNERIGPRELTDEQIDADLPLLRDGNRYAVALVHWGDEYHHYPTAHQLRYGRRLIDKGFDLVIGSHTHSVQGFEHYRDRYIFYSLGNFSFPDYRAHLAGQEHDLRWMARCRWGIMPIFRVSPDALELDSVAVVTRTAAHHMSMVDAPYMKRRLRRFCRAVASRHREAVCARRRAVESLFIRFGEFSVKDRKLAVLANKAARIVRSSGARAWRGAGRTS